MAELVEKKSKINYNLEALRGFVALIVVLSHFSSYHTTFNSFYSPNFISALELNGHLCVLIFFMLSGYVIGISNKNSLTSDTILLYIKKRFIRIYPIYIISIVIALFAAVSSYPISTIIVNFTFMQPFFGKIITENSPLWSLNYEILYYLLFIPISYFNINPLIVLILSLVFGVVNMFLAPHFQIPGISAYSFGFSFWIIGLCIAKFYKAEDKLSFQMMLSNVFLILSMGYNHLLYSIFNTITVDILKLPIKLPDSVYWAKTMINFNDLTYLPYCILFIFNFTSKNHRLKKYVSYFLQILPLLYIPHLIKTSINDLNILKSVISFTFYLVSLFLFFVPLQSLEAFSKWIISYGIKLGGISYGLYIIHFPLLILIGRFPYLVNSGFEYVIRLLLYWALTISISYLLERKYQIAVRNYIN